MKLKLLCILLLFACVAVAQECKFSTCNECTTNSCHWCSLTDSCVKQDVGCPFDTSEYTKTISFQRLRDNLPRNFSLSTCDFGRPRVTTPSQCSRIFVDTLPPWNVDFSHFIGEPFSPGGMALSYTDPALSMKGRTVLSVGLYFVSHPKDKLVPMFNPIASNLEDDTFLQPSMVILAGPKGNYQLGVLFAIRGENQSSVDCAYKISKRVGMTPYYEILYNGGAWGNVAFFVITFLATVIITAVFWKKFEEPHAAKVSSNSSFVGKTYLGESTRQYESIPALSRNKIVNQIFSVVYATTPSVVKSIGTSSLIYFRFQYVVLGLIAIMAFLSVVILLPIYAASDSYGYFTDIATTTVATIYDDIGSGSWKYVFYCFITILFLLLAVGGLSIFYLISRTVVSAKKGLYRNTVMIKNMDKRISDNETFIDHMKKVFGEQKVLGAYIAYNAKGKPTGYSFVTFNSSQDAQECIKHYKSDAAHRASSSVNPGTLDDGSWIACVSPYPNDINWDNLECSTGVRRVRMALGWFTIFNLIVISCIATNLAKFLSSFGTLFAWGLGSGTLGGFFVGLLNFILFNAIPSIIAVVNTIVVPAMHSVANLEKHKTHSGHKRSVLKNMVYYTYLNSVVIPFIAPVIIILMRISFYREGGLDAQVKFYNIMTLDLLMFLLGATFAGPAMPCLMMILGMLFQLITKKKIVRPDFDYEGNYALKLMVLIMVVVYGPQIPLVSVYGLVFMIVSYIVDRFKIMYLCAKQPKDASAGFLDALGHSFGFMIAFSPLYLIYVLSPVLYYTFKGMFAFFAVLALVMIALVIIVNIFNVKVLRRITKLHPVIIINTKQEGLLEADEQQDLKERQAIAELYKSPYHPETPGSSLAFTAEATPAPITSEDTYVPPQTQQEVSVAPWAPEASLQAAPESNVSQAPAENSVYYATE